VIKNRTDISSTEIEEDEYNEIIHNPVKTEKSSGNNFLKRRFDTLMDKSSTKMQRLRGSCLTSSRRAEVQTSNSKINIFESMTVKDNPQAVCTSNY